MEGGWMVRGKRERERERERAATPLLLASLVPCRPRCCPPRCRRRTRRAGPGGGGSGGRGRGRGCGEGTRVVGGGGGGERVLEEVCAPRLLTRPATPQRRAGALRKPRSDQQTGGEQRVPSLLWRQRDGTKTHRAGDGAAAGATAARAGRAGEPVARGVAAPGRLVEGQRRAVDMVAGGVVNVAGGDAAAEDAKTRNGGRKRAGAIPSHGQHKSELARVRKRESPPCPPTHTHAHTLNHARLHPAPGPGGGAGACGARATPRPGLVRRHTRLVGQHVWLRLPGDHVRGVARERRGLRPGWRPAPAGHLQGGDPGGTRPAPPRPVPHHHAAQGV